MTFIIIIGHNELSKNMKEVHFRGKRERENLKSFHILSTRVHNSDLRNITNIICRHYKTEIYVTRTDKTKLKTERLRKHTSKPLQFTARPLNIY